MSEKVSPVIDFHAHVIRPTAVGDFIPESKHAAVLCVDAVKKLLSPK